MPFIHRYDKYISDDTVVYNVALDIQVIFLNTHTIFLSYTTAFYLCKMKSLWA